MNKEAELKRLASIVFEGAPSWAMSAAMDIDGVWFCYEDVAFESNDVYGWRIEDEENGLLQKCKNQPETKLDWTETLLKRSDYE